MNFQLKAHFVTAFPADLESANFIRQVHGALYSWVQPEPVVNPQLRVFSDDLAQQLGLDLGQEFSPACIDMLAGNALAPGSKPYATVYGGHQFGQWAGQLGDGRAIHLGEWPAADGYYALQLKGAGPTPFSRHADGRAVLRSSIREFLCSEAMAYLGIASTRALSLISSDSQVQRDMFYDGHPKNESCAVLCRVSKSFLRFGHFELLAARGDTALLKLLADFTIQNFYPALDTQQTHCYALFFEAVCARTAKLMAQWMSVGFVHGVMNTDNMSILGETIDYGPYGWLEKYDLQWTPNTTDAEGRRYCYGNQPAIAQWNLARLANALAPLMPDVEPLQKSLNTYQQSFNRYWNQLLAAKLGVDERLLQNHPECYQQLVHVLSDLEMDFSLFFDALTRLKQRGISCDSQESIHCLLACSYLPKPNAAKLTPWLASYQSLLEQTSVADRGTQMRAVNPVFVLRNHLVQDVIDAAECGDYQALQAIFARLKTPYTDADDDLRWVKKCPPESMHRAGCSMLSCSS